MGDFSGQANTGVFLVLFGLRWTYCVFMRYHLGRRETALGRKEPRIFKNSLLFPFSCKPGIPIEAYILLIAALFEFVGNFVMGLYEYGLMVNGQHMTMLAFFIVAFIVAILKWYRVITFPNLDYATMILAFVVYGYVFYYHSMGQTMMETQLHVNLVQISWWIVSALAFEMAFPHIVMAACVRCLAICLLGSWLFQMSFILYYPYYQVPWDQNNTMHLKMVDIRLAWHLAGNLLLMFAMASFTYHRVSNMTPTQVHRALDISYAGTVPIQYCQNSGEQNKHLHASRALLTLAAYQWTHSVNQNQLLPGLWLGSNH